MIEVIYKDESQEGQNGEEPFGLPRNIRQIGLAAEAKDKENICRRANARQTYMTQNFTL